MNDENMTIDDIIDILNYNLIDKLDFVQSIPYELREDIKERLGEIVEDLDGITTDGDEYNEDAEDDDM